MGEAKRRREKQVYIIKIDETSDDILSVRRTLEEAKAVLVEWCKRNWEETFCDLGDEEIPPIPEDEAVLLYHGLPAYCWGIFGPLYLDGEPMESDCIEDLDDLGVDTSKFIDDEDEPALP